MSDTQPIIINNTLHNIVLTRRGKVAMGREQLSDTALRSKLNELLKANSDTEAIRRFLEESRHDGIPGAPEFRVESLTLRPGANALSPDEYAMVKELRDQNPLIKARFDRVVTVRHGNTGRRELEDATKLDRASIEQAIRQTSDAKSLRCFREAFGGDKVLAQIIEDQLAATTVTDAGEPIASDVRRDPRNPRRAAA